MLHLELHNALLAQHAATRRLQPIGGHLTQLRRLALITALLHLRLPALRHDGLEIERAFRAAHHLAALRDDRIDVLGGRNVERGVPDIDALVGDRDARRLGHVNLAVGIDDGAADLREFRLGTVFDLDRGTRGRLEIDAGGRGGDDKFDAVRFGQDCEAVGADLIGGVAVAGDAIGTDDDGGDVHLVLLAREEGADHGVGDERGGDLLIDELEGGEARALVVRPSLGAIGVVEVVHLVEAADHS